MFVVITGDVPCNAASMSKGYLDRAAPHSAFAFYKEQMQNSPFCEDKRRFFTNTLQYVYVFTGEIGNEENR
jgi:hypothetical protein